MAIGYDYEYGTSPRKLEPEYKSPKKQKKKSVQKKKVTQNKKTKSKNKAKKKYKMSFEMKFFINSMIIFGVVFAIIACDALVNQKYKEKESLKQEYNELISSANIAGDLNDDIRTIASEYGMQTKSATLINLETSDYIESSGNEVKMDDEGILSQLIQWIKNII